MISPPPAPCVHPPSDEHLRSVLADPDAGEHEQMLTRLGLDKAADFDPADFDIEAANRRLAAVAAAQ